MKKRLIAALLASVLVLTLGGCKKKTDETPAVYTVGDDQVVSLDSVMDEGAAILASISTPTKAAVGEGMEEYVYHYKKMESPSKLAESYIKVLRDSEQGFTLTDSENYTLTEEPDMEQPHGDVILEKASAATTDEAPKIFQVVVSWSEYAVAVQVSQKDGKVLPPFVPEEEESGGYTPPKNLTEQLEYFNSLSPEKLGLPGDSMSEYRVYPSDGWVRVNGISCRKMTVYLLELPEETNTYLGAFYLSSDMTQVYKQNDETGAIELVPLN